MVRIFYYDASCTVQPDGIPLTPVGHEVMDAALVKVPDAATPLTQFLQLLVPVVARHFIELRFVQSLNIYS